MPNWRPISTLPAAGKFLIETRVPTSWDSWVGTVRLSDRDSPRRREMLLRYAVAWDDYPPESGFAGDEE